MLIYLAKLNAIWSRGGASVLIGVIVNRARRATVFFTAAAVAAALGLVATPAVADPPDTVAVAQAAATSTSMIPVLVSGGTTIVAGSQLYRSVDGGPLTSFATSDPGWASSGTKLYSVDGATNQLTRLDPLTGAKTSELLRDGALDFVSDDGYLLGQYDSVQDVLYSEYVQSGVVYRHDRATDTSPCALDATAIIFCQDKTLADGSRTLTITSVPPKGGAATVLGTVPMVGSRPHINVTPSSVVLLAWDYATTATVYRFSRSGGALSKVTVPTPDYPVWAANDTATLVNSPLPHLITGNTVSSVPVPSGVALGYIAAGPSGFKVWGSGVGVSGLYAVSTTGAVGPRVASPAVSVGPTFLHLNAGRLWGADQRQDAVRLGAAPETVWSRALTSPVGSESVFPAKAAFWYGFDFATAGRTYLETGLGSPAPDAYDVTFFDGQTKTYMAHGSGIIAASGPYVGLLNYGAGPSAYTIRRADGALLATLPDGSSSVALFGSRLLYSYSGKLYIRDLSAATSATNPKSLGMWSDTAGAVSMWGDRLAYFDGASAIKVRDARTGTVTGSLTAQPDTLKVDDGIVVFNEGSTLKAWNGVSGSAPVVITTDSDPFAWDVEGAKVAWVGNSDQQARVGSLPATLNAGKSKPRLLGLMGLPSVFAPNVSGQSTTWSPQIDLTKNLSSWSLVIKNSAGTAVRTLTGGTTTNASIRSAIWDGKSGAGVLQPNGSYTWTLTGVASDGSGSPVGIDGTSVIAGSLRMATQAPSAAMTNAALASSVSATTTAPVTWKAVSPAPGTTTSFEVQARVVTVSSTGTRTYGAWTAFSSGTAASKPYVATASSVRQFRVRAKDNFGRIGSWSAVSSMLWPTDDRSLTKSGAWADVTSSSSWAGTVRRSATSGAALSSSAVWTSGISVIGMKAANSGRLKVYVDGSLKATVDLYSASTVYRQTLWSAPVTYGKHTVKVVLSPVSTARAYAYVDAIGFSR
ncbi:hypothetical protein ASD62_03795 [Phycicoccus sp. Root563]|nr:hypothetical protein ASD62_03795 [Phycicoccus sp. Root563]